MEIAIKSLDRIDPVGSANGPTNGMDRKIEKKIWPPRRIATYAVLGLVVFAVVYNIFFGNKLTRLNLETDRLTIATVTQDAFREFIPIIGAVEPIRTVYLDAVSGGRIDERYLEAGSMVEVGDPIVKMDNFSLRLSVSTQETQLLEQLNNLHNTRMTMDQNRLSLQGQLAQASYNAQRLGRIHRQNQALLDKNLIARLEYDQTREEYEYNRHQLQLLTLSFQQDSILQAAQLRQMADSEKRILANLAMLELTIENLVIRAPIAGQLTALDAEIGESKTAGQRLGQIDVLDGVRVKTPIDEFYINRVQVGQTADVDIAGSPYRLAVTKIYPEVENGQFQIDLEFVQDAPVDIRRGQTMRLRLALGNLSDAVLLARGAFFNATGGRWAYVLDADGQSAVRRDIRLGRQNPRHFEVLEGLQPGDRVIVSSYENFGDVEQLVLKGE